MRERDFKGLYARGGVMAPLSAPFTKTQLDAIDRKDEMEDAVTLGLDCMCANNDPNCKECWLDKPQLDEPIKFSIVPDQPKKASDIVSNANLVHARELEITAVTTVSELYEMIDLPYRITKHATLSIVNHDQNAYTVGTPVLRLEWRGEGE